MLYLGAGYPGQYFPVAVRILPAWAADPSVVVEIPMLMVTGGMTRPMLVGASAAQPMRVAAAVPLSVTRNIADRATIPMRVSTDATLEF